ncbi:MAG: prolipoprotein diacylglyceryl transferase [Lachnospiraceae bacterium]|nr:prolipoprotein diacylglyceryl transferase [Lachnospiraceae bacterium]
MEQLISTISEASSSVATAAMEVKKGYDVAFPHLGIFIKTLRNNISFKNPFISGQYIRIAFYGIIIALAMFIAFMISVHVAKKTKQNDEDYLDLFILTVIFGVIGARIYYVIFNFSYYQLRPYKILAINEGGLAIFGGIIAAFIVLAIFCFRRRLRFFQVADTAIIGLPLAQAMGRFGNFFNMEAFGRYTDNIFAMRMRYEMVDQDYVDMSMIMNKITEDGVDYVQAHPTFLYESFGTLLTFIIILIILKRCKKFNGQILATYLIGYGIVRFLVEGLRTDSLMLFGTKIRVSQAVAIICFVIGLLMYIYNLTPLKTTINAKVANTKLFKDIVADMKEADKKKKKKQEEKEKLRLEKERAKEKAQEMMEKGDI